VPAWIINRESVSSDFLEGEVVAIHLGTGIYYSLRGAAATLWRALAQPRDAAGLGPILAAHFEVPAETAVVDAAKFLERLQAERLVVATAQAAMTAGAAAGVRAPYRSPELERFADLQDLLLLDPIHDVGAQGWPNRPVPPEKKQ
jgi:hypothetical protein